MPYTKKQKQAAGAELGRRRKGKTSRGAMADVSTEDLRHIASKKSGTRKKKTKRKRRR